MQFSTATSGIELQCVEGVHPPRPAKANYGLIKNAMCGQFCRFRSDDQDPKNDHRRPHGAAVHRKGSDLTRRRAGFDAYLGGTHWCPLRMVHDPQSSASGCGQSAGCRTGCETFAADVRTDPVRLLPWSGFIHIFRWPRFCVWWVTDGVRMAAKDELGRRGEELAAAWLERAGSGGAGPELAVFGGRVGHRGDRPVRRTVVVFCEVKTRSGERVRVAVRGGDAGQAPEVASARDCCGWRSRMVGVSRGCGST